MENSRQHALRVLAGLWLLALAPLASGASGATVEGEEFVDHASYDVGGLPIAAVYCPGASGFYAADGLDVPGEWILLQVDIPSPGCYESTLAYQTEYGDTVNLRVRMLNAPLPDDEITADHWLSGWGFG